MKKKALFIHFILCFGWTFTSAQGQEICTVCGEYYLESIPEMASGFNIKSDSTFEFFFSNGALDRSGFGTWHQEKLNSKKDILLLNSSIDKKNPMTLTKAVKKTENHTKVQLIDVNEGISSNFLAFGFIDKDTVYVYCNQQGEAILEGNNFDSLQVLFEFCPDHVLSIPSANKNNYFEVKCDESLFEIFFRNFSLTINQDVLEGNHPVIKGKYQYIKSQ